MSEIVAGVMAFALVVLSGVLAWHALKLRRPWLRVRAVGIALAIGSVYVYVLLANFDLIPTIDPVFFGRVILRPLYLWIITELVNFVITLEKCPNEHRNIS